ncbi:MAG: FapA family protein, partial [Candidatus Lindowbacteria bacterium]|nr:FapA family protein [Candidatus Lindowbacteria bacterium]
MVPDDPKVTELSNELDGLADEVAPKNNEVIAEGASLDAAIKSAAKKLGCSSRNVRYSVLQKSSDGFLGIGSRPAKVKAYFFDSVAASVTSALESVGDMDGHFLLELEGEKLMLTVHAPIGVADPAEMDDVEGVIKEYEPDEYDHDAVVIAILEMDGEAHQIGHVSNPEERKGKFLIKVSGDKLSAEVTLIPARQGGKEISVDDVMDGFADRGIVFGVNHAVVKQAVEETRFNVPLRVAFGQPVINGTPGSIEYKFKTDRHVVKFEEDEHGKVNYKNLELIENVKSKQVLAVRIPPSEGIPGVDVYAKAIPPEAGESVDFPETVNAFYDGDEIKSGIDGHVMLANKLIKVSPVYHVQENVNYETGNVDFDGTVRIDGRIEDTFYVRAGGSVFIKKSIGKCKVDVGGNLVVLGGIVGRNEGDVHVEGDAVVLFLENSKVFARGNMTVGELILHSDIIVGGDLEMTGVRASFVGGSAIVGGNVRVKCIGGEGTSRTYIRAGANPALVLEMRTHRESVKAAEAKLRKIMEATKVAKSGKSDQPAAVLKNQIEMLKTGQLQMQAKIKKTRLKIKNLEKIIADTSTGAVIRVMEVAKEGTKIEIGNASMILTADLK